MDESLDQAYRDHSSAVFNVAVYTGGREIADDVTQEVFLRYWRQPETFDPDRGSLGAFLSVLARSITIDTLRSNGARRLREARSPLNALRAGAHDADVLLTAVRSDVAGRIGDAMQHLRPSEKDAIVMAFFGGLSYREVATALHAAEGTVKSRIRTGLRRLALHLDVDDLEAFQP